MAFMNIYLAIMSGIGDDICRFYFFVFFLAFFDKMKGYEFFAGEAQSDGFLGGFLYAWVHDGIFYRDLQSDGMPGRISVLGYILCFCGQPAAAGPSGIVAL